MPEYVDPVYNYIHFASIWSDFPDYEDNSLFIPFQGLVKFTTYIAELTDRGANGVEPMVVSIWGSNLVAACVPSEPTAQHRNLICVFTGT